MSPSINLPIALAFELRTQFANLIEYNGPEAFLIIENERNEFVQFADAADGFITLDLPTQALTPDQARAAEALIVDELGGAALDIVGGHRAFTLKTPAELHPLALLTAKLFLVVYGAPLAEPVKFTLGNSPR
jgi:hypothetical protein